MGCDKVTGHIVFLTEFPELRNPHIIGGRRSADTEFLVNTFDGAACQLIEMEVIFHRSIKEEPQVRLVPYFEEPALHLFFSIPLFQMRNQSGNQAAPVLIFFRHGRKTFVMERCLLCACIRFRHKSQLHKRLHADAKQKIKNAVNVEKRNLRCPKSRDHRRHHDTHIIIEKSMKSQILKTNLLMRLFNLLLHIRPQNRRRMAASHT